MKRNTLRSGLALGLVALLVVTVGAPPRRPQRGRDHVEEEGNVKGGISPELAERIDTAIQKGIPALRPLMQQYLRNAATQGDTRTREFFYGMAGLAALAMVECGVSPGDADIETCWTTLRDHEFTYTYTVAVSLMLKEGMVRHAPAAPAARGNRRRSPFGGGRRQQQEPEEPQLPDHAWIQRAADFLASGCDGGAWNYDCPGDGEGYPHAPEEDAGYRVEGDGGDDMDPLLEPLLQHKAPRVDLSNTQYAILGLKAASLLGVKPRNHRLMWRVVVARLLRAQEQTGPEVQLDLEREAEDMPDYTVGDGPAVTTRARGWAYTPDPVVPQGRAYSSMTACGVAGLSIAQTEVPDLSPGEQDRIRQAIRDGLAWFQVNWDVTQNLFGERGVIPYATPATYYNLYGIERVGVLANFRTIGGHNWYKEGAEYLLEQQQENGSWPADPNEFDVVRTSLALLFLARSTSTEYGIGSAE